MIKLKDIIKEDADIANAKKIKKDLMEVGKFIETGFSKINKMRIKGCKFIFPLPNLKIY